MCINCTCICVYLDKTESIANYIQLQYFIDSYREKIG